MNGPRPQLPVPGLSRRRFIGAGLAGMGGLLWAGPAAAAAAGATDPDRNSSVLVDLTRCIGCRACENACRVRQQRPGLSTERFGYGPGEGRLSFTNWTFVDFRDARGAPAAKTTFPVKKQCMHCLDAACVSACPVAALHKTPRGSVVYEASRCIGCRYCMIACPFNVPRYEWNEGLTPRVGKCDFCDDRVAAGRRPACVEACPTGTLKFGKRGAILREALTRMSANPKRYVSIYGDKVVGGTAWIYLSDVPMDQLGFRTDLPSVALPSLTWKALAKVPVVVVVLALVLSGIYRLRRRPATHD
ncbi:4Fe-4S dicluster domain-containing protein [bacterium]|nr:4Fe-4S dicluster domain-containing protein [bacterium]